MDRIDSFWGYVMWQFAYSFGKLERMMVMTKYILLYNYWDDEKERDLLRVLQELMPDIEVKPFQIIG